MAEPEITEHTTREAWLEARRAGIGASEAAVVVGASPWKTPLQLWAEKRGEVEPDDISEKPNVKWGKKLEPLVAAQFAEETGFDVEDPGEFTLAQHPIHPFMLCTLDRRIHPSRASGSNDNPKRCGPGALEIKTVGSRMEHRWDDEPPLDAQIQLQQCMAIYGYEWGCVAGLMRSSMDLVWYFFERNDRFIATLVKAESEFWAMVQGGRQPAATGEDKTVLEKLYARENETIVDLPEASVEWHRRLGEISKQRADLTKEAEGIKATVMDTMKDAAVGRVPGGGRFTWRTSDYSGYTVEASTKRVLRRTKG